MKNILIILFLLISLDQIQAQVIYLNTNSDDIFKLDITTCEYELVVHVDFNPTDISFHPDGSLFGIDPGGRLVEIDTISGAISEVDNFNGQTFNSLIIAGNGIIYTTGDQGEIWSYNKNTGLAIYIPNTFSPNLDGINDYFKISTSINFNATVNKYLIFDRWGNMIYSANDFSILSSENWWDGTYKRITMNPGVFAYFIEVEDPTGVKESYKGNVTLIR